MRTKITKPLPVMGTHICKPIPFNRVNIMKVYYFGRQTVISMGAEMVKNHTLPVSP